MLNRNWKEELRKQIGFITNSCALYDQGSKSEAFRLATALRVLFHEGRNSKPLIGANRINIDKILSVGYLYAPAGSSFFPNLTAISLNPQKGIAEFIPKLTKLPEGNFYHRLLAPEEWWKTDLVYQFAREVVTRRDIVLWACEKDGGAHVDDVLPNKYLSLIEGAGWKLVNKPDGEEEQVIPFKNAHLAALRQMGFEVLHSPQIMGLLN
jgi:hypothetical protein